MNVGTFTMLLVALLVFKTLKLIVMETPFGVSAGRTTLTASPGEQSSMALKQRKGKG